MQTCTDGSIALILPALLRAQPRTSLTRSQPARRIAPPPPLPAAHALQKLGMSCQNHEQDPQERANPCWDEFTGHRAADCLRAGAPQGQAGLRLASRRHCPCRFHFRQCPRPAPAHPIVGAMRLSDPAPFGDRRYAATDQDAAPLPSPSLLCLLQPAHTSLGSYIYIYIYI